MRFGTHFSWRLYSKSCSCASILLFLWSPTKVETASIQKNFNILKPLGTKLLVFSFTLLNFTVSLTLLTLENKKWLNEV